MNPDDLKSAMLKALGMSPEEDPKKASSPPPPSALYMAALGKAFSPADPTVPAPQPRTFSDTLASLLGGAPTVVHTTPPSDSGARGEYRAPNYGSRGDTLYLNPNADTNRSHQAPPPDFLLSHEMGHRLYSQTSGSNLDEFRPPGTRDPQAGRIADAVRGRHGEAPPTEAFAQAFASALESVRAESTNRQPYSPASYGQAANPTDVAALRAWILKQPAYAGYSPSPIRPDATAVRKP